MNRLSSVARDLFGLFWGLWFAISMKTFVKKEDLLAIQVNMSSRLSRTSLNLLAMLIFDNFPSLSYIKMCSSWNALKCICDSSSLRGKWLMIRDWDTSHNPPPPPPYRPVSTGSVFRYFVQPIRSGLTNTNHDLAYMRFPAHSWHRCLFFSEIFFHCVCSVVD